MTDFIKIDGEDVPAKWNARAKINFEKRSKYIYSRMATLPLDPPTHEQVMILCHEVLREGARQSKVTFKLSLDNVIDLDEANDIENQITQLIFPKAEEVKK